ncbi:MAG: guanine deaminase [Geminicoccaceae bacterium]|nr:guanine deaminase [Geminicoccaceae bacterium]
MTDRIALKGRLLSFKDDPATAGAGALEHHEDGVVLVADGRIGAVGPAGSVDVGGAEVRTYPEGCLILPGLIDPHIHLPQTRVVASYGAQLLEWLQTYTFPEEGRFSDRRYAAAVACFFHDELLRNGTTSAVVFCSVHPESADALFAEAERRGMRMLGGKVMMDRGAPDWLLDTPGTGYAETTDLIRRWHGRGRLGYAIAPRFAITSTEAQLAATRALVQENPGCWLQTHLAENRAEVRLARELYPEAASYTDIYDRFGLLGPRSLFGHCIHLDDKEVERLAATGSVAVFCPTSNLFIGSGLFDLARLRAAGVRTALATDIGGGTSYSMLRTAAEAYKVLQLNGQNWPALDAFHAMTRGNAAALGLEDEIGTLAPGSAADMVVLDPNATPAMRHRMEAVKDGDLAQTLFVLMTMGDDRAVLETWVAGRCLHRRDDGQTIDP